MKQRLFKFSWNHFFLLSILLLFTGSSCSLALESRPEITDDQAGEEVKQAAAELPQPNVELSPEQVVKIQLEALQNNDETNEGIKIAFNFASPDNKRYTGPLNKFIRMVKNPLYRPMLNFKAAEYDPIEISGDTAIQRVVLIDANGQANVYIFSLSKQTDGPCQGCWLTDSVTVEPVRQLPREQA